MKKKLDKLRLSIDQIDIKLLDLVSKRASFAQKVGKLKGVQSNYAKTPNCLAIIMAL